jgi:hypothetical protein
MVDEVVGATAGGVGARAMAIVEGGCCGAFVVVVCAAVDVPIAAAAAYRRGNVGAFCVELPDLTTADMG